MPNSDDNRTYRGIINLDYSGSVDSNERNYLANALVQAEWEYVETSALAYEGPLHGVLVGLELLSRAVAFAGVPSAITFHAQLIGPSREAPGSMTPRNAYRRLTKAPYRLPSRSN